MIRTDFPFVEELVVFELAEPDPGYVRLPLMMPDAVETFVLDDAPESRPTPFGFLLVLLGLVALGFALSGCVSTGEYGAFVKASRSFYEQAAPIVTASVASDPKLAPQSVQNRVAFVEDYRVALEAAEARAGGLKK